jgi:hypothetical protein
VTDAGVISEDLSRTDTLERGRKLGLSSRAAATAYAFQHDLVTRPT